MRTKAELLGIDFKKQCLKEKEKQFVSLLSKVIPRLFSDYKCQICNLHQQKKYISPC